ncbi:hypothetical protein KUCAC02_014418, partial [Chaenocephalus aceratus]
FIRGSHPLSPFAPSAHTRPPPTPNSTPTSPHFPPPHPAKRGGGWKEEKERKQEYQINEKFSYRPRF